MDLQYIVILTITGHTVVHCYSTYLKLVNVSIKSINCQHFTDPTTVCPLSILFSGHIPFQSIY